MKKIMWLMQAMLWMTGITNGFANIDNLTNMSAEWMRTSNRNAATDAADIVVYNPAGLVDLETGFHINFSNQTLFRQPRHQFDDPLGSGTMDYSQDVPDLFLPNLYTSFNRDDWSVFAGIYIPGGGAVADYPNGSYTTGLIGAGLIGPGGPYMGVYTALANEKLRAASLYLTKTIGAAYRLNKYFSLALAVRHIDVKNECEGELTLAGGTSGQPNTDLKVNVEQKGSGFGGVFGVQVKPVEKLNIAFHYETKVGIDLKADLADDDNLSEAIGLFDNGARSPRDFPAMAGIGAAYKITPEITAEVNFNWWFQKRANWGENDSGEDISDMAGDAWSAGAAIAYQHTKKLLLSGGFVFTKFKWKDINAYYEANLGAFETLYSDNWNLSAGFAYEVFTGSKFNFGIGWTIWQDETIQTAIGSVETENNTWTAALGMDVSF
ncbi:MAG: hypothetical protein GY874_05430 [Desulfobacteraceae bacterium]|nr:hypothetical protein [Desulfobacteraceae bacterium]